MKIINGTVLCGAENSFKQVNIEIENDKILSFTNDIASDEVFNAEGLFVIPGFIDTHIHGCVGDEFASRDESFERSRKWLASEGITAFAPTIRSLPPEDIISAEQNIVRQSKIDCLGAKICGINIEGPFVSKSGVMVPPDITCEPSWITQFVSAGEGMLKIMTLAPERENSTETIIEAVKQGVNISIGHTDATYATTMESINAGATRATHAFNAMRPFSHRETGVLGAVLTDERINCEMICDLVHLDEATIKVLYLTKGYKNLTLISDTGVMSGLGDGEFIVNGKKRTVKDGICRNTEGRIAGSCFSMLAGARNLLKMGIPLEEISVMASLNPAKALAVDNETGSIEIGKYADLIVCDKELNIKAVFVNGKRI
ncbi:MAG: N-acetylglucosamine-6-phosphate deacetylase [Ruminococcaceae bacterium]|nr:N-acetylglucosamine-6-phosphate deacetylase [Oscillospiraceae bacterium]